MMCYWHILNQVSFTAIAHKASFKTFSLWQVSLLEPYWVELSKTQLLNVNHMFLLTEANELIVPSLKQ